MFLKVLESSKILRYGLCSYFAQEVEWVSREMNEDGTPISVRQPSDASKSFVTGLLFTAAGKIYPNLKSLCAEKCELGTLCRDIYGREVFCWQERFPCFDSYDYLHENRYYRWFFIRTGNSITRVFFEDGEKKIYVTEDVRYVEDRCLKQMRDAGFCFK